MITEFLPDHDQILLTLLPDPSKVPDVLRDERQRRVGAEYRLLVANEKVRRLDELLRKKGINPDPVNFREERNETIDELSRELTQSSLPWAR